MNKAQKLLITGGLLLSILGMCYGLYYALFDEHQTLAGMGVSMATGFTKAAENNPAEAQVAIETFGDIQFEYRREVHAHSHWISLGMLLMVLGMALNLVALNERYKIVLAVSLLAGAVFFPLGVILQIFQLGLIAKLLSIAGTILVITSMAVITWGFLCPMPITRMPTSDN
jgi:hypothetical protein